MASQRCVLSIDLGGGGPKVALVSEDGEIIAAVKRSVRLEVRPGGLVEQDAEEWWQVIRDAVRELVGRGLVPPEDIVVVSIVGQWSVTVAVDRAGLPLAPALSYMDQRGAKYNQALMAGWPKIGGAEVTKLLRWVRSTGGAPTASGIDVIAHLLFLKNERPDIYRETYQFLEPHDYLGMRLTGRAAASYSSIFPYLLADTRDCSAVRYDDDLIRRVGVDRAKLPELLPVDSVLGTVLPAVAEDWGLTAKTKVMMGSGDSHAAILGSGAVRVGEPHMCIGTSSWITCLMDRRRIDALAGITSMPSVIPGQYMLAGEQGAAGKLLEMFIERWFVRMTGVTRDAAEMDGHYDALMNDADSIPPGSRGTVFLPWLSGAGPPASDGDMRGGFLNITLETDPPQIVRSVMEGIAMNLRWLERRVESLIRKEVPSLNFIGGGARSPVWCQILADVLGRSICQVADPHFAIVRGAALSALRSMNLIQLEEIPARVRIERVFEPDPERKRTYDDLFSEFMRTYRTTRPLFHRWARLRGKA